MKSMRNIVLIIAAVLIATAVVGFLFNPVFIWIATISAAFGVASLVYGYLKRM